MQVSVVQATRNLYSRFKDEWITIVLVVFCTFLTILFIKSYSELNNEITGLKGLVEAQRETIDRMNRQSEAIKGLEEKLKALNDSNSDKIIDITPIEKEIESINKKTFTNDLSHFVSSGIVTDRFVVDRAVFWMDGSGLKGMVDILPQPKYEKDYLGQGRYKTDRALLQNELYSVMGKVEAVYRLFGTEYEWKPEFTMSRINITTSNYKVAVLDKNRIVFEQ